MTLRQLWNIRRNIRNSKLSKSSFADSWGSGRLRDKKSMEPWAELRRETGKRKRENGERKTETDER
jgi:hypothetical protein